MESQGKSTIKQAEEYVVSGDLMRELHEANEHFHKSKHLLEQVMGGSDYQHQEKVDHAGQQLREAERRVEEINRKIHESLKPPPAS
jgi:polyhydroxyalkanoate synthesis regulator phasin